MGEKTTAGRLDWVDTGRGVAILLVPLFHATSWLRSVGIDVGDWPVVNDILSSLRMPMFFALAGLFAGKWLQASWSRLLREKVLLFAWVFLLWEVIGTATFILGQLSSGVGVNVLGQIEALIVSPVLPRFELWFIWALMMFFVLAKSIRRIPPRYQLILSALVSATALTLWPTYTTGWTGAAKYVFFFLAGIYLKSILVSFGSSRNIIILSAPLIVWVPLSVGAVLLGVRSVPGLYFANCVVGVFAGIVLSRILSKAAWLRAVGQRTLPIYLAHTPLIILMCFVLTLPAFESAVQNVAVVLPPMVAAFSIAGSLGLYLLFRRRGWMWAYEPPRALYRAYDRVAVRGTSDGPL